MTLPHPSGAVFEARLLDTTETVPKPNDTSSESSRQHLSNADHFGTDTTNTTNTTNTINTINTIPTAVEISTMKSRLRGVMYTAVPGKASVGVI